MDPHLRPLGQRLRAAQDDLIKESFDFARARSRLLELPLRARHRSTQRTGLAIVLAAVVASCALAAVLLRGAPLEFQVGSGRAMATAGEWIAVRQGEAVPITFSDGTELILLESARARVVDVDAKGATVILERGELRASVVPRQGATWQVFVGPFQVRVTGTRFTLGWQPETEGFSLLLHEGSLLVSGPVIGRGHSVRAGEKLSIARRGGRLTVLDGDTGVVAEAVEVEVGAEADVALIETVPTARPEPEPSRRVSKNTTARQPDFRELARDSKYKDALAAGERVGFEQLCQTAGADEVMLLADVARLAGDAKRARQAYHAVRERFVGPEAGQAAFFLGRLAFDQSADYAEAARYFALSIAEQPGGPLAREAAGRFIEAKVLLADLAAARDASRRYLDRYPDGPHAKTAKRLLAVP